MQKINGPRPNTNVSISSLTRQEKQIVSDLIIKIKQPGSHGNVKAIYWQYVGSLYLSTSDQLIDDARLYCIPCLENIQKTGSQQNCHISCLTSFAQSTSSSNINNHLSLKHGITVMKEPTQNKLDKYLSKYSKSVEGSSASTTEHEFNRDLLIWFCRDLLPFEEVEKEGFIAFFQKNYPTCKVPTAATLSITALIDVYQACFKRVNDFVKDVPSICIMFDGWTDRYRARPFVGIRVCFVKGWKFYILTLSCQVLVGHTGNQLADHVNAVIVSFFPDYKKMIRSSCHDGAANMFKASRVLKVDYFQHCVAHGLHLLLTVDSLNQVPDVQKLILKCRSIVSTLHFKSYLIEQERAANADRAEMDRLITRIAAVDSLNDLDDTFPIHDNHGVDESTVDVPAESVHHHTTLKLACPTRWNSTLVMIESIVDLHTEVQNALKKIGHAELCVHAEELDVLKQLVKFLKEFQTFTELVSTGGPTLSLMPLMELKIRKMCKVNSNDDEWLKVLKQKVMTNVGRRLSSNEAARIQRILDPDTKGLVDKNTATTLLLSAIDKCNGRGILNLVQHDGMFIE